MFSTGPTEISAAVLDENTIIESNYRTDRPASSVVAIYPKEGTFYADHPIGIVNRDYVTPAHEEAAKKYIDFLLSIPQQRSAMRYGFRPADISLSLGAPFDAPHGVDASQPETILEVPEVNVAKAILDRWREQRENPTPNVISVRQPD